MSNTLDRSALESLRVLDTPENPFLKNLIQTYLSTSEKIVSDLYAAAQSSDLKQMGEVAHSLKSSSASLGAMKLAEMCYELEKMGRNLIQSSGHLELAQKVRDEFEAVKIELNKEIQ